MRSISLLLVLCLAPVCALGQAPCDPPVAKSTTRSPNIFTVKQESDLGDAVAEHLLRSFDVVGDEKLTANLARIGDRLMAQMPHSDLQLRYFLLDMPDANAFVLPGGRVFVSRKLVALTASEDELAGVIAHELGHLVARHGAIGMTHLMREVIGVTEVGDRRDIFEKYNRLVENAARKPKAFESADAHDGEDQLDADRLGLYALAKAGYDLSAYAAFFDRLVDTKGKTGNFFSDLFGKTRPEARRLREMIRTAAALPAACVAKREVGADDYRVWQATVVAFTGTARREALDGVTSKVVLEPPLRGEITALEFSPNGQWVLAQDDASINVLSREPFEFRFRIDAADAGAAQFTPDSTGIVFLDGNFRVERWDVAGARLATAHELFVRTECLQARLSPTGKTVACLDTDLTLAIYDVESQAKLFEKKAFYTPNPLEVLLLLLLRDADPDEAADRGAIEWINMGYSPDGRLFAAGASAVRRGIAGNIVSDTSAVAVDVTTRATVSLKGQSKKLLSGGFAFIGSDRIVGAHADDSARSGVYTFPAGEPVDLLPIRNAAATPVATGKYMIVRPIGEYPVGLLDLKTKMIFKANIQPAFAVYGETFVSERPNGEIGLYGVEKNDLLSVVKLPRSPLGRPRALAISPDFKWIAVSDRLRGAVWNLATGERAFHVRGFRGSHFGDDGTLWADFPKSGDSARIVVRLDPAAKRTEDGPRIGDDGPVRQVGPYLVSRRAAKEGGGLDRDIVLEMRDVRTNTALWTKPFPKEAPRSWVRPNESSVGLAWPVASEAARSAMKADPRLAPMLERKKQENEANYFVQILDAKTGAARGQFVVETGLGSFDISAVFAAGDWVVVSDTTNRLLVYSLSTGEQKGRFFGSRAALGRAANLLAVENEAGKLAVYDLTTMQQRAAFTFASPVQHVQFSEDARSLFVLTSDQTAYVLAVGAT